MNIHVPDQSKVIMAYGHDDQAMIHCEECGELIQAISKMRRIVHCLGGPFNPYRSDEEVEAYGNLVEEMADVLICLEQIKEMYGIYEKELQDMVDKKYARQEARLAAVCRKDGESDKYRKSGKSGEVQHGNV